jgi:hypothetical protein
MSDQTEIPTEIPTGTPTGSAALDPFTIMLEASTASANHLLDMTTRASTGKMTPTDLAADASTCTKRAQALADDLLTWWANLLGDPLSGGEKLPTGADQHPTQWVGTMRVTTPNRPLTLRTKGFRRVGGGLATVIPPQAVTFSSPASAGTGQGPVVIGSGVDEFTVIVTMPPHMKAGIFVGEVTSNEHPGESVTDPVMPTWA